MDDHTICQKWLLKLAGIYNLNNSIFLTAALSAKVISFLEMGSAGINSSPTILVTLPHQAAELYLPLLVPRVSFTVHVQTSTSADKEAVLAAPSEDHFALHARKRLQAGKRASCKKRQQICGVQLGSSMGMQWTDSLQTPRQPGEERARGYSTVQKMGWSRDDIPQQQRGHCLHVWKRKRETISVTAACWNL